VGRDIRDLQSRERPGDAESVGSVESTVVGLEDEASGDVFSALTSATARSLVAELHREPATQSELADRVDTSLQNANYHLGRLVDAGVVAVVDELYSEKGNEMSVYGAVGQPFVLIAGGDENLDALRRALTVRGTDEAPAAGD
jgi:DNA-binding transcriptional ArsR family regulator